MTIMILYTMLMATKSWLASIWVEMGYVGGDGLSWGDVVYMMVKEV